MSRPVDVDVLARAMCEAYARNSGNDFKEHFDTRAATIWMLQALDEVGVVGLIEASRVAAKVLRDVSCEICADCGYREIEAAIARVLGDSA